MTDIIEDYLRELDANLRVDEPRKSQITSEIRAHLREKVAEEKLADPTLAEADVARRVIADFGNPHDLALAYGPAGPVLKRATSGEVVLRFGRAVGRGTKTFAKGIAITLAVLLVLGGAVAAWAYHEIKPLVARNSPYNVYESEQECYRENCSASLDARTFHVHPEAREVRMTIDLSRPLFVNGQLHRSWFGYESSDNVSSAAFGTASVIVRDPNGRELYNRTFSPAAGEVVHENLRWSTLAGNWTMETSFADFRGNLEIRVDAIGLPKDVDVPASQIF